MAIEHKPLIEYLPPFLAEYREYQRLFDVLWDEISEKNGSILKRTDRALMNTFITEADLDGVRRWEQMLHIVPNAEETLEERREDIRIKMAGRRPFTFRKMQEILDDLIGAGEYSMEMTDTFELTIKVALTSKYQRKAVQTLARSVVPANIVLALDLLYHQQLEYDGIYTHAQLASYTHSQLREEPLNE